MNFAKPLPVSLEIITWVIRFLAWGLPLLVISSGIVYFGIKLIA